MMSRGEMSSLLRLYAALPKDLITSRPALGVYQAWAHTFTGQFAKVEPSLREIEDQIQKNETMPDAKEILGSIAILRGLLADFGGNMPAAIKFAQRADELLSAENMLERTLIPYVLGDGYFATGELDKAEGAFEQIQKIGQASGNLWTISVAYHRLALLKKLQGKLRAVDSLYREVIRLAGEKGGLHFGSVGATYVGLSDLLRERNELEAARQMVTRAISDMEGWQSPTDLVNGYVTLARISLAQGEIEAAEKALEKASEIGSRGGIFQITTLTLESCQVRLWLAKGDQISVNGWVESKHYAEKRYIPERPLDPLSEMEYLILARVLIARDEWDRALALLSILAEGAEDGGRNGRLIEILVLTALALYKSGKSKPAFDVLTKSLSLARPEGFMRIFLDEGRVMGDLLRDYSKGADGIAKDTVDKLLEAVNPLPVERRGILSSRIQPESLVEHLTEREAEVLRLLAAGHSNQEIAQRLVLSEGTVKTLTHNLYGK